MTNPFASMRIRNIFSQPETQQGIQKRFMSGIAPRPKPKLSYMPEEETDFSGVDSADPTDPNQNEASQYFDQMERVRRNKGPALTAYQQALTEQPTAESTRPSTGRRVGAAIAGAFGGLGGGVGAGVKTANDILDAPYRVAMRDYSNRIGGLGESAKLEQDDTEAQLKALTTARAMGLKYDEFKLKKLESDRDYGVATDKVGIDRDRAATYKDVSSRQAGAAERRATTGEAGQADTAAYRRRQAGTADRVAATGERNAATGEANAASLKTYREKTVELKGKDGKKVSPSQQAYAVDNALRELAQDPKFAVFINTKGKNPEAIKDDGSPMYAEFQRRKKRLAQASIEAGTPFDEDDDDDDDDGDIEIIRKQ